jgi:hypothetical protein
MRTIQNTIQNTQVDVTNFTVEKIYKLCKGLHIWKHNAALERKEGESCFFTKFRSDNDYYIRMTKDEKKEVITFEEFNSLKNEI